MNRLLDVCDEFDYKYPFANEIQLSPYVYHDEDYLIHICSDNDISIIAYSSLGYDGAEIILGDASLMLFAQKIQITTAQQISTAQLILSWLISKNICVIPKSNSYQRQEENFKSCGISVASVAPFLSEIDNLSKEERVAYLAYNALGGKQSAEFLKW
jgi:diketogulonate reductase-like aldo/keto reductase